jgi:methionine synthase II (cobalamin-independent)
MDSARRRAARPKDLSSHDAASTITDAGLLLQLDDPDLPDGWQMFPDMTVPEYRRYAALRVEALNHALRGIPPERVRLHVCWGSGHPELVAQRLLRFAKLVGAENLIAGTDCGLGNRVGHPEIVWAKLEDLSEGALIASRALSRHSR